MARGNWISCTHYCRRGGTVYMDHMQFIISGSCVRVSCLPRDVAVALSGGVSDPVRAQCVRGAGTGVVL